MTFLILMGTAACAAAFLLAEGLIHLRESVGPWTSEKHEYDDAWRRTHRA